MAILSSKSVTRVLLCGLLSLTLAGCNRESHDQIEARTKLHGVGIEFTDDGFVAAVLRDDEVAVKLFLSGGFSPEMNVNISELLKKRGGQPLVDDALLPVLALAQSLKRDKVAAELITAGASEDRAVVELNGLQAKEREAITANQLIVESLHGVPDLMPEFMGGAPLPEAAGPNPKIAKPETLPEGEDAPPLPPPDVPSTLGDADRPVGNPSLSDPLRDAPGGSPSPEAARTPAKSGLNDLLRDM